VTVTATSPIMCIRPLSMSVGFYSVSKSGNQYTYTFAGGFSAGGGSPVTETFAWYLFDRMSAAGAGDSGVEVFDATGTTTFNSNFSPMIVSAVGTIPNAALIGNPASIAPGSGTYAVCLTEGRRQSADDGYPVGSLYMETVKVNGTGAATSYGKVAGWPLGAGVNVTQGGSILLVDVAGL